MTRQCPNCFFENKDSAQVCEVCGTVLSPSGSGISNSDVERNQIIHQLSRLRTAFILELIFSVFSYFLYILLFSVMGSFTHLSPVGNSVGSSRTLLNALGSFSTAFTYLYIELGVSIVFTIIIYALAMLAFGYLKTVKREFSAGYKGAILLMVSEIAEGIMIIVMLSYLLPLITSSASSSSFIGILGPLIDLLLGLLTFLIIAIVGVILFAIGLYRLGSSFGNGSVEAGAIINIFIPFVGAIFLIYGINKIIRNMQN